jgi:hypothetical protein
MVGIDERATQGGREPSPDGRLSAAHHSDKYQIAHLAD